MPSSSGIKSHRASRLPTLTPPTRTTDPTTITSPVTSKLPVHQSRRLKASSVSTRSYQHSRPVSSPAPAKSLLPAANRSRSSTLPARADARSCPTKPEPIAACQQSPPTPATKSSGNISRRCPECHHGLLLPPSIESLRQVYPTLVVNESINRSVYTCRNCAYLAATRRAMQNQFMWPNSANYLLKLDGERKAALKKLEAVQDEVDAGIEAGTDDLDALAKRLQDAHDAAAKVQEIKEMATNQIRTGKRLAWVPFWAVWGKMEGQEGYVSEAPLARE